MIRPKNYENSKRFLDLIIGIFLIFLFWPLFLLVSLGIKLSSEGTIFYKHEVVGKNEKRFICYKFRTMQNKCDKLRHTEFLKKYMKGIPYSYDRDGKPIFKVNDDSSVTKFGRFLRRTSIDELPRLINVLKGEMSMVGPRPPVIAEYQMYKDWYKKRFLVKPGITGLHQITGRSRDSFKKMFQKDLYYIRYRSIWLDLYILLKTVQVVLRREGAY